MGAVDDDLGTPEAIALVFDLVGDANAALDRDDTESAAALARTAARLLDVLGIARVAHEGDAAIDALVAERLAARAAKDFAPADRIRDELRAQGIEIEDTATGAIWRRL